MVVKRPLLPHELRAMALVQRQQHGVSGAARTLLPHELRAPIPTRNAALPKLRHLDVPPPALPPVRTAISGRSEIADAPGAQARRAPAIAAPAGFPNPGRPGLRPVIQPMINENSSGGFNRGNYDDLSDNRYFSKTRNQQKQEESMAISRVNIFEKKFSINDWANSVKTENKLRFNQYPKQPNNPSDTHNNAFFNNSHPQFSDTDEQVEYNAERDTIISENSFQNFRNQSNSEYSSNYSNADTIENYEKFLTDPDPRPLMQQREPVRINPLFEGTKFGEMAKQGLSFEYNYKISDKLGPDLSGRGGGGRFSND